MSKSPLRQPGAIEIAADVKRNLNLEDTTNDQPNEEQIEDQEPEYDENAEQEDQDYDDQPQYQQEEDEQQEL